MDVKIPLLLVDDDEIQNFIAGNILKYFLTIQPKIVLNGKEALAYLEDCLINNESAIPSHILLDINMPVMDGFTFLKAINRHEKLQSLPLKIAMLTTSMRPGDREIAFQFRQVTYFIEKPLTKEKLNVFIK